jgi:urate oxidase
MKTSKSAFSGFPRDEYTTLAETDDRLLATKVSAVWRYLDGVSVDYDASFEAVSRTLLDVFADHFSVSVQASIWIIGQAIVERHPEVAEITMTLPNLHHWLADIERFGIANDRQVYVSTTEPHGLIQATVRRS